LFRGNLNQSFCFILFIIIFIINTMLAFNGLKEENRYLGDFYYFTVAINQILHLSYRSYFQRHIWNQNTMGNNRRMWYVILIIIIWLQIMSFLIGWIYYSWINKSWYPSNWKSLIVLLYDTFYMLLLPLK
jgi:magnesium-transporting ATPase (P-type)